jgi:hypothetical protein
LLSSLFAMRLCFVDSDCIGLEIFLIDVHAVKA